MSLPYVLLIHGWTGSGPEHWQSWLAGELARHGAHVDYPHFSDPDAPDVRVWLDELTMHLDAAPRDVERVVVAHSLGCHLWLHHAAREVPQRVDRVLLVAPPAPDRDEPALKSFLPPPLDPDLLRRASKETRLVVGDGDPWCTLPTAKLLAEQLRVDIDVLPGAAHINTDAGYGPWPAVLKWVRSSRTPLTPR